MAHRRHSLWVAGWMDAWLGGSLTDMKTSRLFPTGQKFDFISSIKTVHYSEIMYLSQVLERPCSIAWTGMRRVISEDGVRSKLRVKGKVKLSPDTHWDGLPQDMGDSGATGPTEPRKRALPMAKDFFRLPNIND